jgi:hypothetical protein
MRVSCLFVLWQPPPPQQQQQRRTCRQGLHHRLAVDSLAPCVCAHACRSGSGSSMLPTRHALAESLMPSPAALLLCVLVLLPTAAAAPANCC